MKCNNLSCRTCYPFSRETTKSCQQLELNFPDSEFNKARLHLQVVKTRVIINNALTDLQEWIDKNL